MTVLHVLLLYQEESNVDQCVNVISSSSFLDQYDNVILPWLHFTIPVTLDDLKLSVKACTFYVIVIEQMDDMEKLMYFEAGPQFLYDTYFVLIVENQNVAIGNVMKTKIIRDSHFLVALQPILGNGEQYAAYRSTFQTEKPIELFDILDEKGFKKQIFNEKLSNFMGKPTNVFVVKYPPNVIVTTDENGKDHFGGFEIELFNVLAKAVNSEVVYYTSPQEYYFEDQVANVSGGFLIFLWFNELFAPITI